jgi:hypothetical protein
VVRHRVLISTICILVVATLSAQQSDEVKQKPLEIRKADAPESPSPHKSPSPKKKKKTSPTPTPTAKPKSRATPKETPEEKEEKETPNAERRTSNAESEESPTPKASPRKKKSADEETPKPKKSPSPKGKSKSGKKTSAAKKKPTPEEEETPVAKKKHSPKPSETSSPKATASAPRAVGMPSPSAPSTARSTSTFASPPPSDETEQLTIEKSGYERPRSFWERIFGGGGRTSSSGAGYRYLTRSVRDAIDRASPDRRNPRWQLIVVHNSGTRQGNARVFDYYHKHVRHMQNGLAYHFVIGNGTSTGNGQIEIGDRWRRQINGGHVHSDYLNNIALGICLVGDFNRDQPTRAQLDCCEELVRYLRQRCGKIDNHFPFVRPHREVNPPRWGTDCPGDAFPYSWFRRFRE